MPILIKNVVSTMKLDFHPRLTVENASFLEFSIPIHFDSEQSLR